MRVDEGHAHGAVTEQGGDQARECPRLIAVASVWWCGCTCPTPALGHGGDVAGDGPTVEGLTVVASRSIRSDWLRGGRGRPGSDAAGHSGR